VLVKRQPPQLDRPFVVIPIGHGLHTLISPEDYDRVSAHKWRVFWSASLPYVGRKVHRQGKVYILKLHRFVTDCPRGFEPHHVHGNTFDNRREELECLTPEQHRLAHHKSR